MSSVPSLMIRTIKVGPAKSQPKDDPCKSELEFPRRSEYDAEKWASDPKIVGAARRHIKASAFTKVRESAYAQQQMLARTTLSLATGRKCHNARNDLSHQNSPKFVAEKKIRKAEGGRLQTERRSLLYSLGATISGEEKPHAAQPQHEVLILRSYIASRVRVYHDNIAKGFRRVVVIRNLHKKRALAVCDFSGHLSEEGQLKAWSREKPAYNFQQGCATSIGAMTHMVGGISDVSGTLVRSDHNVTDESGVRTQNLQQILQPSMYKHVAEFISKPNRQGIPVGMIGCESKPSGSAEGNKDALWPMYDE
ncbi:hypothetical protein C8R48DRAFT_676491 [Suillus tomentosus]|nr:hypothetical protein C8R48DRAFT_676491 [Suillus tomentosus]